MSKFARSLAVLMSVAVSASAAMANDRYVTPPPVRLSPNLAAPWVMQLQGNRPVSAPAPTVRRQVVIQRQTIQRPAVQTRQRVQQAALAPQQRPTARAIDPMYLPQTVAYNGREAAGTIVVDTRDRFLYLVNGDGTAKRYGVGVGKAGFEWRGSEKITRKAQWPSWRPPAAMIEREKKKGRFLPTFMPGGPENPLGARALYLGSTLYRIHGTNQPWTIGQAVSSGCIRMRNEDVTDLYERVKVGARVVVL
ncbi:MAG: L,D-transpeptidase [Pseudomonadota bacterium]